MFNPWRHLGEHLPHVDIIWTRLPGDLRGLTDGRVIWMDPRLTQVQRRCTIAHEAVHCERGVPADAREERAVEVIAARRLVALDALVDALVWSRHTCEVASELWVDVPVLVALVRSLSGRERAWIDEQLHERGVHQ
ncbi:MAG TPA: hypothetical protein PK331_11270 [Gordonia sp. (in: high G+C Gram-positive bacteria)]|uniref:hypothetical protein n=1 Tax=unclassified Gordonia (in: high G+C Gram-positive bacteria) TaxID=2657482 RepID=UPI0025BD67A9|nr:MULTISPECIES: hypothetical protein [unclassified Gordonia (in: high G+C Gram-positive bacteria)]HNP57924.1 hypothetical protein [Gordonia sp. (in: high G+C Gram-positive bacteria)]HRC51482.1 hypothetical protein [Gordonia sp. (in: high G+C Gram-positive bacteria)]